MKNSIICSFKIQTSTDKRMTVLSSVIPARIVSSHTHTLEELCNVCNIPAHLCTNLINRSQISSFCKKENYVKKFW